MKSFILYVILPVLVLTGVVFAFQRYSENIRMKRAVEEGEAFKKKAESDPVLYMKTYVSVKVRKPFFREDGTVCLDTRVSNSGGRNISSAVFSVKPQTGPQKGKSLTIRVGPVEAGKHVILYGPIEKLDTSFSQLYIYEAELTGIEF